jgi:hypothetical protein
MILADQLIGRHIGDGLRGTGEVTLPPSVIKAPKNTKTLPKRRCLCLNFLNNFIFQGPHKYENTLRTRNSKMVIIKNLTKITNSYIDRNELS